MPLTDADDLAPDESGATPVPSRDSTAKDALSGVDRALQLEDLNEVGVQKMVLDRLDRAESRVLRAESMELDYYATREKLVEAKSALKRLQSLEVLQDAGLAVGSALVGFLPSAWGNWGLTLMVFFGAAVLIGGVLLSKRKNDDAA